MDRPPPRRPEFDSLTTLWGADSYEDLGARIELTKEFLESTGVTMPAEEKMLRAMEARHIGFRIAAGELEPAK